ncbi:MAG: sodium:proton antiporter [Clostridiales Family XIII bacterium]|jgi:CPA1 family monovalent cation:H+ antiporter|nr:sodium:proton antiporter [Clostridiales Family XIII bacterium]
MELTSIIVILLFAIALSRIADSVFPGLPLPLIQVGVGALLVLTPLHGEIRLEPEVFMALLVAPILFREAEETDILSLWRMRRPVIFLAFLLVFITVFAIGFTVHALVPIMPLAACFALGAILGPTDAIAVGAISDRVSIRDDIMSILRGEGLINDASGVISFHFAVAALLTGAFSPVAASLQFLAVCAGGFAVGFVVASLKDIVAKHMRRISVRSSSTFMIIEILTPFICYLLADALGVSGIIAAVTAGIRQALSMRHVEQFEAEFSVFKRSMWDMLTTTFNSLVFLLLGFQLPDIVISIVEAKEYTAGYALGIAAVATAILLVVRFAGVFFLAAPRGASASGALTERMRDSLILTLSGVKGTVSLATAFSLPYYIAGGGDFAQRALLLFVTAATIIFSLLIAVIVLPLVARKDAAPRVNAAHIAVLREVIDELSEGKGEYTKAVVLHVKRRIKVLAHEDRGKKERARLRQLRAYVMNLEREMVEEQLESGELTEAEAAVYLGILSVISHMAEGRLVGRGRPNKRMLHELAANSARGAAGEPVTEKLQQVFWKNTSRVVDALESKRGDASAHDAEAHSVALPSADAGADSAYVPSDASGYDSDIVISELIEERIDMTGQIFEGAYGESARVRLHAQYDDEMLKEFETERGVIERFRREGRISEDEADSMRIGVNSMETYLLEGRHNDNMMKLVDAGMKRMEKRRRKRREAKSGKK